MSYVFGAIDALANLFGYSMVAGIGVFVLAIVACNLSCASCRTAHRSRRCCCA